MLPKHTHTHIDVHIDRPRPFKQRPQVESSHKKTFRYFVLRKMRLSIVAKNITTTTT